MGSLAEEETEVQTEGMTETQQVRGRESGHLVTKSLPDLCELEPLDGQGALSSHHLTRAVAFRGP